MVLFIDNYDSFTYNLVQYFGEKTNSLKVIRNDEWTVDEILNSQPTHIVLSPGPCTPDEAGVCVELCQRAPKDLPLLGICLGHQALGQAYGAKIPRGKHPIHGKTSHIKLFEGYLFEKIPRQIEVVRYHSLIVDRETLPDCLSILALDEEGVIMAMQHKEKLQFGLQFHPESFLSQYGKEMIQNFLNLRPYDC